YAVKKVLSWLSSLQLTVSVLLWTAGVFIVATVIPQHQVFPFMEGLPLSERFTRILSVTDIFHSLWLFVPLLVLSLNLICCMFSQKRAAGRTGAGFHIPKQCSFEQVLSAGIDPTALRRELGTALSRGWHLTGSEETPGAWLIAAEKGRLRIYAPFVLHVSIILIFMGAVLGLFGFKGAMEIREGESTDSFKMDSGIARKLPFSVRCDEFKAEYYQNGTPREYISEVSFMQGESIVEKKTVRVNHPASFGGIMFSQSAFHESLTAKIAVHEGGEIRNALAGEDEFFLLHEGKYRVHVKSLKDDVMHLGPAVELLVDTPEGSRSLWIFRDRVRFEARFPGFMESHPEFNPSAVRPFTFVLESMAERYTTVLFLNRDPGVFLVASGAFLFLVGVIIIFLVRQSRVRISIEKTGAGVLLRMNQTESGRKCDVDGEILAALETFKRGVR
ncbi:hypothetical protein EG829_22170, partial [bacterium]|nr:hypothetical protein [bacterium]